MSLVPAVNPVLERELRQRLRGRSAWIVLTLYLAVLAVILRLVYGAVSRPAGFVSLSQAQSAATAGRSIFHWLLFFMLSLVCFIVPGVTAAAIAGERERQTLIPLQVTLLSARSIVVGKLLASLAFVVLLVLAALPLLSVPFLLGGVDAAEVVKAVAMLLVVAVVIACTSLASSSAFHGTQVATVTAYAIVAALVIGTALVYGAQRALDRSPTGRSTPAVLVVNPFAAMAAVVHGRTGAEESLSSPFTGIQSVLEDELFSAGGGVGSNASGVTIVQGPVRAVPAVPGGGGIVFSGPAPPAPLATAVGTAPPLLLPPQGFASSSGSGFAAAPPAFRIAPPRVAKVGGMPFWLASLLSYVALAGLALLIAMSGVRAPARGRAE